MRTSSDVPEGGLRRAGYSELIRRFDLSAIPHWHESSIAPNQVHRVEESGGMIREVYTNRHWPGDSTGDHLEFALNTKGPGAACPAGVLPLGFGGQAIHISFRQSFNPILYIISCLSTWCLVL